MPIGLRIRGLFEDLPCSTVTHADDVQAKGRDVDYLPSDVVDCVYAGFPVISYFPYAV